MPSQLAGAFALTRAPRPRSGLGEFKSGPSDSAARHSASMLRWRLHGACACQAAGIC
jgi:hypothetical protein